MYVSLNWVNSLLPLKSISLFKFCDKLTLAGFEIENLIVKQYGSNKDIILDVSLTANRSDLISLKNFSQEIKSIIETDSVKTELKQTNLLNKISFKSWEYKLQNFYFLNQNTKKKVKKTNHSDLIILSLVSDNIKIQTSPNWIQHKLLSSNINPNNNITDLLNYIMLETGYVFWAFDFDKLLQINKDLNIKSRYANEKEVGFNNILLSNENLLLTIGTEILAIVGIVQNPQYIVTKATKKILLVGSFTGAKNIRKSSQKLGIRTTISTRLEKQLTLKNFEKAWIRGINLFWTQGISFENALEANFNQLIIDKDYCNLWHSKTICLKYQDVFEILGLDKNSKSFHIDRIHKILDSLDFRILFNTDEICEILIPNSRFFDIERDIDIIEEIGRMYGFDRFKPLLPNLKRFGKLSTLENTKRKLRMSFLGLGLKEVTHYTLGKNILQNQINLKNPIVSESSSLRKTLLDELINRMIFNQNQDNQILECFEIGRVYDIHNDKKVESEVISGIFGGKTYKSQWNEKYRTRNWFEAKGLLNEIFIKLQLKVEWKQLLASSLKHQEVFHPTRTASLSIDGQTIGKFGQIHPILTRHQNISKDFYIFEFDLKVLNEALEKNVFSPYLSYSIYPSSIVELSLIVNDSIPFSNLSSDIEGIGKPFLEKITLFDYYYSDTIPTGCHSVGLKLQFRSTTETLKTVQIDEMMTKIVDKLNSNPSIKVKQ